MAKKKSVNKKLYHSKLLLFGEHLINQGARGLAIPTDIFEGNFNFIQEKLNEQALVSNKAIQELTHYIVFHPQLSKIYNTNQLLSDLERGLYFQSNIPQGYGIGSSGALVAGLCDQYRNTAIDSKNFTAVKEELAQLESFFHGKSSGLDPMVCFYNQSVLVENGTVSKVFALKKSPHQIFKIFLVNTHNARKTEKWVRLFLTKCAEPKFAQLLSESLVKASDTCIDSFLVNKYVQFWKSLQLVSQIHFDHFTEFIPEKFHACWKNGLRNHEYYLKLCGAGGGGFILGFCKADVPISQLLSGFDIVEVMTF